MEIIIRKATIDDAESITDIWKIICDERIYSAIDEPFSLEEEKRYLSSLSDREGVFLAIVDGKIVGFQTLDLWAKYANSFSIKISVEPYVLVHNTNNPAARLSIITLPNGSLLEVKRDTSFCL